LHDASAKKEHQLAASASCGPERCASQKKEHRI